MKSNVQIAKEVIDGKWGNGGERRSKLVEAGYNYDVIQELVNAYVRDGYLPTGDSVAPAEPEKEPIKITGTECLEVTVNLNKYNSIRLVFEVE